MFEVCYNIGNMIIRMHTVSIDMSDDSMVRLCSLCAAAGGSVQHVDRY